MSDLLSNVKMGMYGNTLRLFGLSSDFDTQSLLDAEIQIMELKNTPYTNQQTYITQEKTAWSNIKTYLTNFTTIVEDLKKMTTADKKVTNSDTNSVSVTATSGALEGNYNIVVENKATNHKIKGNSQTDSTTPLGYSATVKINKVDFTFTEDMSLNDVATKVNQGEYGVNAVVIGGSLIFTAKQSGAANKISFEDSVGTKSVVSSSNTSAVEAKMVGTPEAGSNTYQVEVTKLLQGQKNSATNAANWSDYTGSFTISQGSNTLTVDLKKTDGTSKTEQEIIDEINTANKGVKASIVDGKLQLDATTKGVSGAFTVSDNTNSTNGTQLFADIGFKEDITAQDAEYTVNGVAKTSGSEKVTDAIAGVELTLKELTSSPVTISTSTESGGVLESLGFVDSTGNVSASNEIQAAQDAKFTVDGIEIVRSTNTISDAISGVTINLLKVSSKDSTGNPIASTIDIEEDSELLKTKVDNFVSGYNQMVNLINQYAGKGAVLQGQSIITRAKMDMGNTLMKDTPSNLMLFQIGISIDGTLKDGSITFDSTKLAEQLEKDPDEVMKMLTGSQGIAGLLYEKMNNIVKTSGTIDTKIDSLTKRYDDLQDTIDKNEEMFEKQQETLLNKYSNFESIMGTLSSTSQYMDAIIESMNSSK